MPQLPQLFINKNFILIKPPYPLVATRDFPLLLRGRVKVRFSLGCSSAAHSIHSFAGKRSNDFPDARSPFADYAAGNPRYLGDTPDCANANCLFYPLVIGGRASAKLYSPITAHIVA